MEEKEFRKKERRKLLIVATFCLVAIISIIGYTYSYFVVSDIDSTTITGTVASASLNINVVKKAPSTNNGLVPQLDSAITSAVVGTKGNCIDDNGNEVCQVYEVTVTNTSSAAINIDGKLELNAGSNTNLKWALINSYTSGMTTKPTLTAGEKYAAGEIKKYYIVIWISELGIEQEDTGIFTGTITFMDSLSSPSYKTLKNLNLTSSIQTDTPDFSKTSCSSGCGEATVGIYSMEDDLGISYYFRGDVENNYVKFANLYWRIIRINGDGTVRMIYDGTTKHPNGESSTDRQVTTSPFNEYNYEDIDPSDVLTPFVGYMYGEIGATSYEEIHDNITDSTIKTYLEDTWYANTIKNTTYEQYISDAIYCNDKSARSNGYYYGPSDRINEEGFDTVPTLKCKNQNDRFTYNASVVGVLGNDKLEAPVGLITVDEVSLAGSTGLAYNEEIDGYVGMNLSYYLYSGNKYWTMSPRFFGYGDAPHVFTIDSDGSIILYEGDWFDVSYNLGVRPVITLYSDALKYSATSNGSMQYPFTVTG